MNEIRATLLDYKVGDDIVVRLSVTNTEANKVALARLGASEPMDIVPIQSTFDIPVTPSPAQEKLS